MTNYDSIWQPIAQQSWHSLFLIFGPSAPKRHRPATRSACAPASSAASNDLFTCSICAEFHQKTDTFLCVSNSIPYIELYIELYRIDCIVVIYQFHAVSSSFCYFLNLSDICFYIHLHLTKVCHMASNCVFKRRTLEIPACLMRDGLMRCSHTRVPQENCPSGDRNRTSFSVFQASR